MENFERRGKPDNKPGVRPKPFTFMDILKAPELLHQPRRTNDRGFIYVKYRPQGR